MGVEALVDTGLTVVGVGVLLVVAGVVELPAGLGVDVEFVDDGVLGVVVLGLLVDGWVDTVEVTDGVGDVLVGLFGVVGDADGAGDFDDGWAEVTATNAGNRNPDTCTFNWHPDLHVLTLHNRNGSIYNG